MTEHPDPEKTAAMADVSSCPPVATACWSCKGPVPHDALFCPTCNAVQGPGQANHFKRFGIEANYDVKVDVLEQLYFNLQRELHPDRFAGKSATEKNLSQQQAVALNEAFETLKSPLGRADYLLKMHGKQGVDHDGHTINDPVLLMEAMEMREALAMAEDVKAVAALMAKAEDGVKTCEADLTGAFAENRIADAENLALRLKYLTKLLEEARQRKLKLAFG